MENGRKHDSQARFLSAKAMVIAVLLIGLVSHRATAAEIRIFPEDNGRALTNPGMGWSYGYNVNSTDRWFHYFNPGDTAWRKANRDGATGFIPGYDSVRSAKMRSDVMGWFPGCSSAFVRLGWSFFYSYEPDRKPYDSTRISWKGKSPKPDFHRLERIIDRWAPNGGKIGFAIILYDPYTLEAKDSFSNAPPWLRQVRGIKPGRWVRALWVRNDSLFKHDPGGNRNDTLIDRARPPARGRANLAKTWIGDADKVWSWVPDYDDSVMIRELDHFLRSLRAFLDAKKSQYGGREIVDFIEIGTVGTWGEGHQWPGRYEDSLRTTGALKAHLDIWRRNFPGTRIFAPDEIGLNQSGLRADGYPQLLESARKLGMGLADHSVSVFTTGHSDTLAHYFNDSLPVLLEMSNGKIPTWDLYHSVERMKASYSRINSPAAWYLDSSKAVIDSVNLRLGYRFRITEAAWTKNVAPGKEMSVTIKVRNAGVARCYAGGYLAVHLFGSGQDALVSVVDTLHDVRNLDPGPQGVFGPEHEWRFSIRIPGPAKKGLRLKVSIGDRSGNPVYALPHGLPETRRYYDLGPIGDGSGPESSEPRR